ncbi:MAG: hypothetical protein ACJ74Q_24620 [Pyrinomonadaceae bacterium]
MPSSRHGRYAPRFGRAFISASISNVFLREFGPDIIAIFRH